MFIDFGIVRLCDQHCRQRDTHKIRRYVAQGWQEYDMLHNHAADGDSKYRYPLVQYKVLHGRPLIIGLQNGVHLLQKIVLKMKTFASDGIGCENLHKELRCFQVKFGSASDRVLYQFVSPWMPIRPQNVERFPRCRLDLSRSPVINHPELLDLLQSAIVDNVMAAAKAVNYAVRNELAPRVFVESYPVKFQGRSMPAFKGYFEIGFELPDLIGLGEASEHGFGTVQRVWPELDCCMHECG